MKGFEKIVGHDKIIEYLDRVIEKDFVSNVYIFSGNKGLGKFNVANIFAKNLQNNFSDMNSDIQVIDKDGASISVDEIRTRLVNDINIKPMQSRYKIYIIRRAHKLTVAAQNAILKTLEETPEYGIIILVTSEERKLLPTIRSRSIILKFTPPPVEKTIECILEKYNISSKEAYMIAKITDSNVGDSLRLAQQYVETDIWKRVIHVIKHVEAISSYEIATFIKSLNKDDVEFFLKTLQCFYHDMLSYKISSDPNVIVIHELRDEIMKRIVKVSYNCIYNSIDAIVKAAERIEANANIDSILEVMLFNIKEANNGANCRC